jgi:glycosyltransferase involved in cell wall biosynthesis
MRVGIDAMCWANGRGYGRFTRELVSAMVALAPQHEFVCVLDRLARDQFHLTGPNVRTVVVDQAVSPTRAAAAHGSRSLRDMLRLGRAVAREQVDVFFSPTVYTYFPLPLRLPAVVTIHDVIAERYPKLTLPTRRDWLFWQLKVKLAITQAKVLLTVSNFAALEIAKMHGLRVGRIRVALEAPAAAYQPSQSPAEIAAMAARVGVPPGARWLTYVGGFNPHKNLPTLIRAHRDAASRLQTPLHLVLIGSLDGDVFHAELPAIREAIRVSGTEPLVHWTGFLPDEDIRHLHSGAVALVLPSTSEGFGLPAVEAAACGTPVIATAESPLPIILEGGGLFIRPGSVGDLAEAITELATNEVRRQQLGQVGLARARALDWRHAAQAAMAAVEDAAR